MTNPTPLTEAYCVNLESRPDRWMSMRKEIRKFPKTFKIHRFKAIENTNSPRIGCADSHVSIIKEAEKNGRKFVVVFEDDVEFNDSPFENLSKAISLAPKKWDIIMLGYYESPLRLDLKSEFLSSYFAQGTHCVIYRDTAYKFMLGYDEKPLGIDDYISYLAATKAVNLYLVCPPLARQKAGYSNIKGDFYDWNSPAHALKTELDVFRKFYRALYKGDINQMLLHSQDIQNEYLQKQCAVMLDKYRK